MRYTSQISFMDKSKFIKFAGLVGIIGSIFCFSAIFASTLLCGPGCGNPIPPPFDEINSWADDGSFSWKSNALSDLGVSEVANIYNSSLIVLGIVDLIFIIGFVKAYAKSALFYLGGILLIIASVSISLVGVFTEAYATPHMILAMAIFVLEPIGLMLVGLAFRRMNMKTKGHLSILIGIISLLVTAISMLIPWYTWLDLGAAVPEIVAFSAPSVWTVWMGISLIRPE